MNEDGVGIEVANAGAGGNSVEEGESAEGLISSCIVEVHGDADRTLRGRGGAYMHWRSVVMQLTQAGRPSSH